MGDGPRPSAVTRGADDRDAIRVLLNVWRHDLQGDRQGVDGVPVRQRTGRCALANGACGRTAAGQRVISAGGGPLRLRSAFCDLSRCPKDRRTVGVLRNVCRQDPQSDRQDSGGVPVDEPAMRRTLVTGAERSASDRPRTPVSRTGGRPSGEKRYRHGGRQEHRKGATNCAHPQHTTRRAKGCAASAARIGG